jgi:hypothetical protein
VHEPLSPGLFPSGRNSGVFAVKRVEAPGIEPAKTAEIAGFLNGSTPEEPSEVPPKFAKSGARGHALGTAAELPPASYNATWGALEGAAGVLATEVLAALRQGDVTRARVAARSLAAVVEACAGAGASRV